MDDPSDIVTPTTHPHRRTFERVREHLLRQGRRAEAVAPDPEDGTPVSTCLNRTVAEDGAVLRCAVGCLIPDDLYRRECEGHSITALGPYLDPALEIEPLDVAHSRVLNMLMVLRDVHDATPPCMWAERLEQLAVSRFDRTGRWITGWEVPS